MSVQPLNNDIILAHKFAIWLTKNKHFRMTGKKCSCGKKWNSQFFRWWCGMFQICLLCYYDIMFIWRFVLSKKTYKKRLLNVKHISFSAPRKTCQDKNRNSIIFGWFKAKGKQNCVIRTSFKNDIFFEITLKDRTTGGFGLIHFSILMVAHQKTY